MSTLWRILASGGFAAFTCQSLGLALIFLAQIGFARVLGAESFGVLTYVMAWVGVLGITARCGLDTAVLRDAGIYASRNDWTTLRGLVAIASRWTIITGTVVATGLVITATFVDSQQAELRYSFWIGAALLPIAALGAIRQSALLALNRPWAALAPEYIVRPVLVGAMILALWAMQPSLSASLGVSANLAAVTASTLIGQLVLTRTIPGDSPVEIGGPQAQALKRSAATFLWLNGSSQLLYQVDTIMVGALISPTSAGKYYAAKQIALIATLGLIALQLTSAPRIAALNSSCDRASLQRLLSALARRGFAFAAVYALFLLVAGRAILRFFGAEFEDTYPVMMVLILGQLIAAGGGAAGQVAAMAGLQTVAGAVHVSATLLTILAGSMLIHAYGALGAAISVVVTTLLVMIALNTILSRKIGVVPALVGSWAQTPAQKGPTRL